MFCIILRLTPTELKQKAEWRTPTVLLLIPTVCCQDVTVPVRDKVAIILPPRSLSSPALISKLWLSGSKHQPVLSWDPMSESLPATPAQVSKKPAHWGRRSYGVKKQDCDWPLCVRGLSQVCLCGCSQPCFSQGVWVRYLDILGGKCVSVATPILHIS